MNKVLYRVARNQLREVMNGKRKDTITGVLKRFNLTKELMIEYLNECAVKELEPYKPYDFLDAVTAPGNIEKNWIINTAV